MKLCQKCAGVIAPLIGSAVKQATEGAFYYTIEPLYTIVSESECEFWAHKELRETLEWFQSSNWIQVEKH